MRKVKTFFHVFTNSFFPQTHYYRNLLKTPLSFSLKYFFGIVFLVNLLFFLFITVIFNNSRAVLVRRSMQALQNFPADLHISIKHGMLTTNYDRPYFLWVGDDDQKFLLAVIDETATQDKIKEYPTEVLFTKQAIVLKQTDQPTIYPYGNASLDLSKASVSSFLSKVEKLVPFLLLLAMGVIFIAMPVFEFAAGLFYLVIVAFLCFLIFKLYSKKHTYVKTFQVSLHAVTLPILVKHGLFIYGYNVDKLSPLFSLLAIIFILCALYETYIDR